MRSQNFLLNTVDTHIRFVVTGADVIHDFAKLY